MIGKRFRFHGHKSLNFVYTHGKSVRSQSLALKFAPSKREDYKLAVVVSRKVSKSAVVRNRIRRRLYESVRLLRKESVTQWPYEIVITVFDEQLATMPSEKLTAQVRGLFKKAGIAG